MHFQGHDLACLRAVKERIDKHLTADTFTLEDLAHKASINEHKLKNGFKQLFWTARIRLYTRPKINTCKEAIAGNDLLLR